MSLLPTLILEVFKVEDALKMGLFDQDEAVPTLRHYSQIKVSFTELSALSLEMVNVLNLPAPEEHSKITQEKNLRKIGQLFWDHLLTRPIKEKLKSVSSCALILSLDEELIYIPWELIFDGREFLSLKFSLGRLVRSRGESNLLQYRQLADSLKMLILANPEGNLKSAYAEGLNIKNQFSHKQRQVRVDFKAQQISKSYVQKNICDYDLVHFAGHCEWDKSDPQRSGWVLTDGILRIEDILKMGQSASLPALIFSNACHSAQVNTGVLDLGYQKASYSMASAFLFAGVRHYIGAIRKIEDQASLIFAKEFYARLVLGVSVGEALRLSRLRLIKEYGEVSLHWVNYLLYGDPGYVFFNLHVHRKQKTKFGVFFKKNLKKYRTILILSFLGLILLLGLPKINPGKFYLFSHSQSQYQKGNNQAAVSSGEQLLRQDKNFLAIYPILADALERLGEKEKARKYYFDYVLRSEKLNNLKHLVQAYIKLGWFYQLEGQFIKAKDLYDKALVLSIKMKDRFNEAVVLRKLAVWQIERENYALALELLTKSVAINSAAQQNAEYRKNLASDYFDIGLVFANKDDYPAAKEFYEKSRRIFIELRLENELSDCYFNLGEIAFFEKEYQKALNYYEKGLAIDQRQKNQANLASGYNMIGELYLEIDNLEQAEIYFKQALVLAEKLNILPDQANANYDLGLLYKKQGRKNLAREFWRRAQEMYRTINPAELQKIREQLLELDN